MKLDQRAQWMKRNMNEMNEATKEGGKDYDVNDTTEATASDV
jgi:hypothetical protein